VQASHDPFSRPFGSFYFIFSIQKRKGNYMKKRTHDSIMKSMQHNHKATTKSRACLKGKTNSGKAVEVGQMGMKSSSLSSCAKAFKAGLPCHQFEFRWWFHPELAASLKQTEGSCFQSKP
jgi:hypothetical protein